MACEVRNDDERSLPLQERSQFSPHQRHALGFAILGAAGIAVALIGLSWWTKAGYFHDLRPYDHGWAGYDVFTFIGLLLFTLFAPTGVTMLYVGVSTLMRLSNNMLGQLAFGTLGVVFVVFGSLGMMWGKETMGCLGVFCLNTTKHVEVPGVRPEAGLGFLSVLGITIFFSLVPMGFLVLIRVVLKMTGVNYHRLTLRSHKPTVKRTSVIFSAAAAFVIMACWALITFYMPNSWESFTAARIATKAQLIAVRDGSLCAKEWKKYTCPELPWSWVFTRNWVWNDMVVLKMYPSNIFFFMCIFILLLTVTVIRATCAGRKLLRRRCFLLRNFTFGEVGFTLLSVIMLVLFFLYWIQGHNFNTYWTGGDSPNISLSERWARSLGQLGVALLSFCIFPATRCSLLHFVLGTSWESSIWVHKVLGYGMLLAITGHMVAWYFNYAQNGTFPRDIFSIPMQSSILVDNFTVPLITLTSWFMFITVGFFALGPVRRNFFELFYYPHIISFYMIVPTVLWHAAASWEYLLPGLTVWFLDRLLRMYRSASTMEVLSAVANGLYVELRFRHATLITTPGQYCFVNIPEVSLLQWHPFSFSGADENCHTLHIKSMGDGTWTGQLLNLVNEFGSSFTLSVDGPYGRIHDFTDYTVVVLVAGGIGVTPCAAIYNYLRQQRMTCVQVPAAVLLWTVRDAELVRMMSYLWDDEGEHSSLGVCPAEQSTNVYSGTSVGVTDSLRLFFTGSPCDDILSLGGVCVSTERLDVAVEIPDVINGVDPRSVLVFACGPDNLIRCARDVAVRLGANFHEEVFLL